MFDQNLYDLSDGTMTMENFAKKFPLNISPVYDDNPFFYNFDKTLPSPFRQLYGLLVLGLGVVVMVVSVKKSPDQVKLGFVRPFARHKKMKWFLLVFLLLGVGFMMLEIALFQKLTFYLGNPVSTTSLLLFSLLSGVGLGSLSSAWVSKRLYISIAISTVLVFILSLAYNYLLDDLLVPASSVQFRAGLLTGLLGIAMGFPFPLALRLMNKHGLGAFTAAMWGANGLASVAGSVTAMIIGIEWGFTEAVFAGGILYLLVALLVPCSRYFREKIKHRRKRNR
jgi:MFS family permease